MAGSRVREIVNAAVDALRANATLTTELGGSKVYTHVVENASPPYAIVLGGDEIPWAVVMTDTGDDGARQVDVLIQCVSKYRGTSQVDELASLVMETLTDQANWSGVDGFQLSEFVRNALQPPAEFQGEMWFIRTVTVRVSAV